MKLVAPGIVIQGRSVNSKRSSVGSKSTPVSERAPKLFRGSNGFIKTADVVDGFYSFLGFPRLVSGSVVKKAIAKGIQDGFFAYYSGSTPVLGSDGKYQVPLARVRSNAAVSEDEIDLESGFLMTPQPVPVVTPLPGSTEEGPTVPAGTPLGEPPLVLTPGRPDSQQGGLLPKRRRGLLRQHRLRAQEHHVIS
jgi:hypothetical protein